MTIAQSLKELEDRKGMPMAENAQEGRMKISQLQKKVKFVSNAEGKLTEVVLPYESYQEYLDMKVSLELYESLDTQESIKKAREDLATGRFKDYEDIERLIQDLHG